MTQTDGDVRERECSEELKVRLWTMRAWHPAENKKPCYHHHHHPPLPPFPPRQFPLRRSAFLDESLLLLGLRCSGAHLGCSSFALAGLLFLDPCVLLLHQLLQLLLEEKTEEMQHDSMREEGGQKRGKTGSLHQRAFFPLFFPDCRCTLVHTERTRCGHAAQRENETPGSRRSELLLIEKLLRHVASSKKQTLVDFIELLM